MAEYIVGIADDSVQDVDRLHREYAVNGMIVRCRDCEHGEECVKPYKDYWCHLHDAYHYADWFCADGERRETE